MCACVWACLYLCVAYSRLLTACACVCVWIEACVSAVFGPFTFAFVCDYCYYILVHVHFVSSASFCFILLRTHIRTYPKSVSVWRFLSFRFGIFSLFNDGNTAQSAYACMHRCRTVHASNITKGTKVWAACTLMWAILHSTNTNIQRATTSNDMAFRSIKHWASDRDREWGLFTEYAY